MKDSEDPIGDLIFSKIWKVGPKLIKGLVIIFLRLPHILVESLYMTGRGVSCYGPLPFIVISGLLFTLSALPTPAGDALFLLSALFAVKWVSEFIWAVLRRRAGSREHKLHRGVSLGELIGVRGDALPLLAFAFFGLMISATPQGALVGPLFVVGGFGGLLINAFCDLKIASENASQFDAEIEMEIRDARLAQHRFEHQDVHIE